MREKGICAVYGRLAYENHQGKIYLSINRESIHEWYDGCSSITTRKSLRSSIIIIRAIKHNKDENANNKIY